MSTAAELYGLNLINASRAKYGKAPVVMYEALRLVARAHAKDMATRNYFGHTNPEGINAGSRISRAGISWTYYSENIGVGSYCGSPSDCVRLIHNAMMAEVAPNDGHRVGILNSLAHRVGVGVATSASGKTYFVSDYIN